MKTTNQQSLKEAINQLLTTYHLDSKLNELNLMNSWQKVMGVPINKHTKRLYVQKKTLYVLLDSAVLRQELSYGKEKIINMLNAEVGKEVIDKIVFK